MAVPRPPGRRDLLWSHPRSFANGSEPMPEREYGQLRVLVANQLPERAKAVSQIARSLGHEVVALELDVDKVGEVTRREHPDVALVGLGEKLHARARADRADRPRRRLPGDSPTRHQGS